MNHKRYWPIFILVFVSAAIALYLDSNRHLFAVLGEITLLAGIYLIMFRILFLVTNGLFLREFTLKFDVRLSFKECFGLSALTSMANYISPFSGGLIARAAYLKYRHTFPYAQFATLVASNYLVAFWVVGVVGIVASAKFAVTTESSWEVVLFFMAVVVVISTMAVLPSVKLPGNNWLSKAINNALEGWHFIKNDRPLLLRLAVYSLFNILLNGLSFLIAYNALGLDVSFTKALLIGLMAVFSILVNITPGNFGIQEAVVSLSSGLLGVGTAEGLLAALLVRAAMVLVAFTLGPIFSFLLTRELTAHRSDDKSETV